MDGNANTDNTMFSVQFKISPLRTIKVKCNMDDLVKVMDDGDFNWGTTWGQDVLVMRTHNHSDIDAIRQLATEQGYALSVLREERIDCSVYGTCPVCFPTKPHKE